MGQISDEDYNSAWLPGRMPPILNIEPIEAVSSILGQDASYTER